MKSQEQIPLEKRHVHLFTLFFSAEQNPGERVSY